MPRNVNDVIRTLSPARRKKVEARAAALIAEEMSLRELRQAHRLTQQRVAKTLGIGQEGVSKLEKRTDLLLSTLREYVEAMGGTLSIVAAFPDHQPVIVTGLVAIDAPRASDRHGRAESDLPGPVSRRPPTSVGTGRRLGGRTTTTGRERIRSGMAD
jgi:transcriptional regulator with XRE-family HTH domain